MLIIRLSAYAATGLKTDFQKNSHKL